MNHHVDAFVDNIKTPIRNYANKSINELKQYRISFKTTCPQDLKKYALDVKMSLDAKSFYMIDQEYQNVKFELIEDSLSKDEKERLIRSNMKNVYHRLIVESLSKDEKERLIQSRITFDYDEFTVIRPTLSQMCDEYKESETRLLHGGKKTKRRRNKKMKRRHSCKTSKSLHLAT